MHGVLAWCHFPVRPLKKKCRGTTCDTGITQYRNISRDTGTFRYPHLQVTREIGPVRPRGMPRLALGLVELVSARFKALELSTARVRIIAVARGEGEEVSECDVRTGIFRVSRPVLEVLVGLRTGGEEMQSDKCNAQPVGSLSSYDMVPSATSPLIITALGHFESDAPGSSFFDMEKFLEIHVNKVPCSASPTLTANCASNDRLCQASRPAVRVSQLPNPEAIQRPHRSNTPLGREARICKIHYIINLCQVLQWSGSIMDSKHKIVIL